MDVSEGVHESIAYTTERYVNDHGVLSDVDRERQTSVVRKNKSSAVCAHSYKARSPTSMIRSETRWMHIFIAWRGNVGRSDICCIRIVDVVNHLYW